MALASIVANFKYIQKGLGKEKSSRYLHRVVINGSILIDIPVEHKLLVSQSSYLTLLFCYSQVSRLEKLIVIIPALAQVKKKRDPTKFVQEY